MEGKIQRDTLRLSWSNESQFLLESFQNGDSVQLTGWPTGRAAAVEVIALLQAYLEATAPNPESGQG